MQWAGGAVGAVREGEVGMHGANSAEGGTSCQAARIKNTGIDGTATGRSPLHQDCHYLQRSPGENSDLL